MALQFLTGWKRSWNCCPTNWMQVEGHWLIMEMQAVYDCLCAGVHAGRGKKGRIDTKWVGIDTGFWTWDYPWGHSGKVSYPVKMMSDNSIFLKRKIIYNIYIVTCFGLLHSSSPGLFTLWKCCLQFLNLFLEQAFCYTCYGSLILITKDRIVKLKQMRKFDVHFETKWSSMTNMNQTY